MGVTAAAAGVLTFSEDGLDVPAGGAASAAGGLTASEDGLTVAVGAVAASACVAGSLGGWADSRVGRTAFAAGAMAVSEDGLTVAAGAGASEAGVLTVAFGAAFAAGAMTVSDDGMTVATGAAAAEATAAAQCSEIIFSWVTAKPFSEAPEVTAPLALCPISFTAWPRCGLRSTLLVVILKV